MVDTVTDGSGTTHWFSAGESLGEAMVFVSRANPLPEIGPLLVYFHGHNSVNSIRSYVPSMPGFRDLRPLLAARAVLLVQPWGGQTSNFARVTTAAGLQGLIDGAMRIAIEGGTPSRPCPTVPTPPDIIFAGHSGGGTALLAAARTSFAYSRAVQEVWAFDCMYGEAAEVHQWVAWSRANPGKTFRIRASTHEKSRKPREAAEAIARALPNADVEIENRAHDEFPGHWMPQLLPRTNQPVERRAAHTELERPLRTQAAR